MQDLINKCIAGEVILSASPQFVADWAEDESVVAEAAEDGTTTYHIARVQCRICGGTHMAAWPEHADETAMECNHCGHMTAEPMCESE